MTVTKSNLIDYIIEYESGELSQWQVLELFAYLIKSSLAWSLQGFYGRQASALIDNNYISQTGEILVDEGDLE